MKKILFILMLASLFFVAKRDTFAANDFLCQCVITGQFGSCDGWQATDVNCNDASQPVADNAHCGICGGAGSECIVACVAKSQVSTRNYGEVCNQVGSITITCNADPGDPSASVTCRPAADNTPRCLKTTNAIGSGSGTAPGSKCKDSSECSGFNNTGFNSICTNLPNTSGAGQQTFNVCTIEQYRNQFNCAQSGTVYKCTSKDTGTGGGGGGGGSGSTQTTKYDGTCGTVGIQTAIGCVPIGDVNQFAGFFLKWGLGFAGGIGMLFTIYASFMVMTSQGDPKRLQSGKELLVSAISGIILIVFSVFILRLLGVSVLGIF